MSQTPLDFVLGEAQREAVRAVSPLALDCALGCGLVVVPVEVAALGGAAEEADASSSHALRAFLDDNPFSEVGSLSRVGWLLLAETEVFLTFGLRVGSAGLSHVVTFLRTETAWGPVNLFSPQLVMPVPFENAEPVLGASAVDCTLVLTWGGEIRLDGQPSRALRRVEVLETPTAVHVLVVSGTEPHVPMTTWGAWEYKQERAVVELRAPLGERAVHDNTTVPAHRIDVTTS